jgi:hypothetical protein
LRTLTRATESRTPSAAIESRTHDAPDGEHRIEIVFDRPMKTDRWSFVGATTDVPAFLGQPSFDASRTTLSVLATFEAGRTYRFWLNNSQFQGFASADGVPLASVEVRWSVAMPDAPPASAPAPAPAPGAPGGPPAAGPNV